MSVLIETSLLARELRYAAFALVIVHAIAKVPRRSRASRRSR
jgi:hypothetical protein